MKVVIDQDGCIECASCEATCPQIFVLPSGEKANIIEKFRTNNKTFEGEIGDDLAQCAKDAADACPVTVITVK
jgi:ferredoxin